jgi:hypothetical protein
VLRRQRDLLAVPLSRLSIAPFQAGLGQIAITQKLSVVIANFEFQTFIFDIHFHRKVFDLDLHKPLHTSSAFASIAQPLV